jgi:hypothetical protein
MRTLIGAVLVSVAVTSATFAVACPIDLAPCEEVMRPRDTSIDAQINRLILASSVFKSDHDIVANGAAEVETVAPLQELVLLNHEDDFIAADHQVAAAMIPQSDHGPLDIIDPLPDPAATGELAAVPSRKFLLEDEDLSETGYTGSVGGPSAHFVAAQPELALDGYEDL